MILPVRFLPKTKNVMRQRAVVFSTSLSQHPLAFRVIQQFAPIFQEKGQLSQKNDIELFRKTGSRVRPRPRVTQDLLTKAEVRIFQNLETGFMIRMQVWFVKEYGPLVNQVGTQQERGHGPKHIATITE